VTVTYDWIMHKSKLPWLKLDIKIPHEEMLSEAKALEDRYVGHRTAEGSGAYSHKGWKSLCIHGISATKTNHFLNYGYKSNSETPYKWTEVSDLCPVTTDFFKNKFPYSKYFRLRFMLLEPGGYITPHKDTDTNRLSPINIALNHPEGCKMKMRGHKGYVPFTPGDAMLLDVGNEHAYINKSDEGRYHIIVHGLVSAEYKKLVIQSYEKNGYK
jgi:hypothetical protein